MSTKLSFSLESELEVDKLLDKEKESNKSGEYDTLYNNIKNKQTLDKFKSADETIVNDAESEVDVSEGSDIGDTEKDSSDDLSDSPNDTENKLATENIRNMKYQLVTEDFDSAKDFAINASNSLFQGIKYLVDIGIQYGPGIASNVYKGVTYVFSKLAKMLLVSLTNLTKYIARRTQSFESIKNDIITIRKSLDLIKNNETQNDLSESKYTNVKIINQLKISNSTDIVKNIKQLESFLTTFIINIDTKIKDETVIIKHLIAYSTANIVKSPINLMKIKPFNTGLTKGNVEGYETDSDLVENYKYNYVLPGDVVFIAQLPKEDLNTLEDVTQAYNDSSMFFGLNSKTFKNIDSINYMSIDDISKLLDSLDKLVNLCISHQSFYENIKKSKSNIIHNVRNYFLSIASSKDKVSLKNSLVEYVYLKYMFIDKVYLLAAIDIDDYTAKVLVNSLSYIKDNVKKLS